MSKGRGGQTDRQTRRQACRQTDKVKLIFIITRNDGAKLT